MYSRIKLSSRLAMSNSYIKILPDLTAMIFLIFIFSVCNLVLNTVAGIKYFFLIPICTLLAFVLIISPIRIRMETKHFLFARGLKSLRIKPGFLKSLVFYPAIFCLRLFWFAVFEAIPITGAVMLYFYLTQNSLSAKATMVLFTCIAVLGFIGFGFYCVFIQRYSQSAFYLVCYKDFSVSDAIRESVRKTQNNLVDILLFKISFLPWFLLSASIVPMLFVIPYYKQSLTIYFINKTGCSR